MTPCRYFQNRLNQETPHRWSTQRHPVPTRLEPPSPVRTYLHRVRSLRKKSRYYVFLLEALLIIVLLSVSLTTIIGSFVTSLRANVYSAHYSTAILLADNRLFTLMQKMKIKESVDQRDFFSSPFESYRYQVRSKEALDIRGAESLQAVDVDIFWNTGNKEGVLSLSTLLLTEKS